MRFLNLSVLLICSVIVCAQNKLAVYVMGTDPINSVLADGVLNGIAKSGKFVTIERSATFLEKLAKEQALQQSGFVDDDEISRIGKQFGAQFICVVGVTNIWSEKYLIARIINTENAEIISSSSAHGIIQSSQQLNTVMNVLIAGLLNNLNQDKRSNAKKVAVYLTRTGNRDVDIILGDQLVSSFSQSNQYYAIERTNFFLAQINKEHDYQYNSGAIDDDELTKLGRYSGVDYVCVAKTSSLFGDYYISARLINVETAQVENNYEIQGRKIYGVNDIVKVAQEIAEHLSGREQEQKQKAYANRDWREFIQLIFSRVTQLYTNGNKYTGSYDYEGRQGMGAFRFANGAMYLGNYFNNERSGYGMYIAQPGYSVSNCPRAMVYVGDWQEDYKHGTGTCYDSNGNLIYYGKFRDDRPIEQYPSSSTYTWTWKAINYSDGSAYIGELLDGNRSGVGLFIWKNGDAWYGSWKNDTRNGRGIFMDFYGDYQKGNWINNTKQ